MNKLSQVGLIASGKLVNSFILDLPEFKARIGPVKAASLRVASRIANTLQAGFPVADYDSLDPCPRIFICVPDGMLPETFQELCDSPLDLVGRTVVLCDSPLASDALHDLEGRGAYTASINLAPGRERMIVADGHPMAISSLRSVIGRAARLIRIQPHQKWQYSRALATASLCGPLAAVAAERFRESGLTAAQAKPVVQAIFLDAVRDYMKSGRNVLSNSADPEGAAVLIRVLTAKVTLPSGGSMRSSRRSGTPAACP
jgi:hypothetical protein